MTPDVRQAGRDGRRRRHRRASTDRARRRAAVSAGLEAARGVRAARLARRRRRAPGRRRGGRRADAGARRRRAADDRDAAEEHAHGGAQSGARSASGRDGVARHRAMLRVALTGGIATGKSYVLERVPPARRAVPRRRRARARRDGARHGGDGGDRRALRRRRARRRRRRRSREARARSCSPTPAARRDLEAIVHPAVYRAIAAGLRAFELIGDGPLARRRHPAAVRDRRTRTTSTRVIVTACPPETQLARLRERGLSERSRAPAPRRAVADRRESRARRLRDRHRRHVRRDRPRRSTRSSERS